MIRFECLVFGIMESQQKFLAGGVVSLNLV